MAIKVKSKEGGAGNESQKVIESLRKQYGESVALDAGKHVVVPRLATGVFPFDFASGGGFPYWRTSMVWGPESSGKTALLYKALAATQVRGLTAVLIDAEHVFDPGWVSKFGVDLKKLVVISPDNGEQVVDACQGFLAADDVGIVGLDSLAALAKQTQIDSEPGTANVGGNTQLVSKLFTKTGAALTLKEKVKRPVMFVVINQIRHKIGVMFGDPETQPGGFMPKFTSSLSVRLYGKKELIKDVSPDMPCIIQTKGVIKKWRVPILRQSFEYDLPILTNASQVIGQVKSWNTVAHHLQLYGCLEKVTGGYTLFGETFPTLKQLELHYNANHAFRNECQSTVFEKAMALKDTPDQGGK